MISSLIMCVLMAFIIMFFVAATNSFSPAAIIYSAFLIVLFVLMTFSERRKKGSSTVYRRIFQVVFAVGFCIAFISDLIAERGSMAITSSAMSNAELPFCHIAIPQVLVPFVITKSIIFPARIMNHYASVASMISIWLIVTLIIGRGWCSWVCFYGGWEEGFSHVAKKRRLNLLPHNKEVREFHFAFLLFIVLVSLCELACVYCEWFCPFKLVTEYSPVNSIPSLISAIMFIGLFVVLVVVMPILAKRRTQCSTLCPFGAFASLTDRISPFQIKIDTEKCKGCMKCASVCPFGSIDIKTIKEKKGRPESTCAKCGECIRACPENAISLDFRFSHGCGNKKPVPAFFAPDSLFRFAAFSFGIIISSDFMVHSLEKITGLIIR